MPPSRRQTTLTWVLVMVWLALMMLGAGAVIDPPWLEALSRQGAHVEATDYKNHGDDALRQGKPLLAIPQYQQALAIQPDEIGVAVNLAIAWMQVGNLVECERILGDALAAATSATGRGIIELNLGELRERQRNRSEAIVHYRRAIAHHPDLEPAHRKLGTLLLEDGQLEAARVAFEATLALQLDVGRSYRDMLRRVADLHAGDTRLARIADEQLGRPIDEAALAPYDFATIRATQLEDRAVAVTHNYLGWIAIQLHRFEDAGRHFRESERIWPGNPNATNNLRVLEQMRADGAAAAGTR